MASDILLVEDRDSLRQMLRLALQAGGHNVLEAGDEVQAAELLQRHRPALVLTDLKLPKGDGFGILKTARQLDPDVPVILLTAYGVVPDAVRSISSPSPSIPIIRGSSSRGRSSSGGCRPRTSSCAKSWRAIAVCPGSLASTRAFATR